MNWPRRSDWLRERNALQIDAVKSGVSADASYSASRRRTLIRRAIVAIVSAALLLAALTVPAAPAHAHIKNQLGLNCTGNQVEKCLWINVDHHNQRVRGYASVGNVEGGPNYWVAVNNIRIEVMYTSGVVVTVSSSSWHDEDGWHWPEDDTAATGLVECIGTFNEEFRVKAHMRWRPFGSDDIFENDYVSRWVTDNECFTA
jgi:hypothetical protein